MSRILTSLRIVLPVLLLGCATFARADDPGDPLTAPVKIQCVAALKNLLADAIPKLSDAGIKVKPAAGGGSSDAYAALGAGLAEIVLTMRPMTGEERAAYPEKTFQEFDLGKQAVALIIPEILWNNGIRALTREQAAGIYESQFTNWNQLGGPNRTIQFLNPTPGQGVWEMFATWLYGDVAKAGAGHFETVENGEKAAAAVEFNSGALSVAYVRWANEKDVFALPIKMDNGAVVEPSLQNVASGKYPLCRSVYMVAEGRLLGNRRAATDFFTGRGGRELLLRNDVIPTADLAGKAGSAK